MMLLNNLRNNQIFTFHILRRHLDYWTQAKKRIDPIHRALDHFDDFYGEVYGDEWTQIRKALVRRNKYVAILNNYGDEKGTRENLESIGAYNVKTLFESRMRYNEEFNITSSDESKSETTEIQDIIDRVSQAEIDAIYDAKNKEIYTPDTLTLGDVTIVKSNKTSKENEETSVIGASKNSLEFKLNDAAFDESRIIEPHIGMSSSSLWTFVPANKLKGAEDWIPESEYYSYYKCTKDYPLTIESEDTFNFPEHLKIYIFEPDNKRSFPEPKRDITGVLNYYLMDAASILPVLALDLKPKDRFLDLCAAPGGKSLVAIQTLLPDLIVANDVSRSRKLRVENVFKQYLYDYRAGGNWDERIRITNKPGQGFTYEEAFDKILVDVPCTTDRHSVKENDNNIFHHLRVKERLRIPELQAALLCNALSLCRVGGTVVYSTCTLSPIQNDGVVHMSLKQAWEDFGIKATIKNLTKLSDSATSLFKFTKNKSASKYGKVVTPHLQYNYGPLYFCKLVRTQ